MGRQFVEHDADQVGLRIAQIDEVAHALGEIAGGALVGDLDLARQDRWASRKTNRLAVPLRRYSQSWRSSWPGVAEMGRRTSPMSWVGLVEAHDRPLRIGRLGIQVEHVFHAGDIRAIDFRDAPHVLAPGLEIVLRQAPAHCLV
jgi:hypothetical protein